VRPSKAISARFYKVRIMHITLTQDGQPVPSEASNLPAIDPINALWASANTLDSSYHVQRKFDARPRPAPLARNTRRPTVLKRAARRSRRFVRYSVAAVLLLSTGFSTPASSRDSVSEDYSKRLVDPQ
jgi:hypothetical protein